MALLFLAVRPMCNEGGKALQPTGCCLTQTDQSQLEQIHCHLFSEKAAPLNESGGPVEPIVVPCVGVAFFVNAI